MYKYALTDRPLLTLISAPDNYDPNKNRLPNPLQQLLDPEAKASTTSSISRAKSAASTRVKSAASMRGNEQPIQAQAEPVQEASVANVESEALQGRRVCALAFIFEPWYLRDDLTLP